MLRRHSQLKTARTVLDLGAGEGRYLPEWQQLFPGAKLTAVDYSPVAVRRSAARHPSVEHVVASAQSLPLQSACLDGLVSIEVIEHVADGRQMLAECARVLRPNGWALISTPCGNAGSLEWMMNVLHRSIRSGQGDGILFGRTDDPTHLRRYRSGELERCAALLGLQVEERLFGGHVCLTLASRLESLVNSHLNIRRRSATLADGFTAMVDAIGMLDWWLLRRLPSGSTMLLLFRKAA